MIPVSHACGLEAKTSAGQFHIVRSAWRPNQEIVFPYVPVCKRQYRSFRGYTSCCIVRARPKIIRAFRDALNRVRNTAWAAQQYANRKASDQDSTDILGRWHEFVLSPRTNHLCRAVNEDLKQTDIQFQRGSLIELGEITKALRQQLNSVITN